MQIGFGTLFWGGIFVALTATAITIVAVYYLVRWLYSISQRRMSRRNRSGRNCFNPPSGPGLLCLGVSSPVAYRTGAAPGGWMLNESPGTRRRGRKRK